MNLKDCKLGTKVRWYGEGPYTIDADGPEEDGRIWLLVQRNLRQLAFPKDLHLVNEKQDKKLAAKTQKLIDKAKNAFEEAYKAYEEANKVSYENGMGLYQMEDEGLISTEELEEVVEGCGWSMSSLGCSIA